MVHMVDASFFDFCLGQEILTIERTALFKEISWERFEWYDHHVLSAENYDACRNWPVFMIPLLKSLIDDNMTRAECVVTSHAQPGLRDAFTQDVTIYFESIPNLTEEVNLKTREAVFEHLGYRFEEPGCFAIFEKCAPFSRNRFENLAQLFPPRKQPFQRLPSTEFLYALGQAQPISEFTPGHAKATEDMCFEKNPIKK